MLWINSPRISAHVNYLKNLDENAEEIVRVSQVTAVGGPIAIHSSSAPVCREAYALKRATALLMRVTLLRAMSVSRDFTCTNRAIIALFKEHSLL